MGIFLPRNMTYAQWKFVQRVESSMTGNEFHFQANAIAVIQNVRPH